MNCLIDMDEAETEFNKLRDAISMEKQVGFIAAKHRVALRDALRSLPAEYVVAVLREELPARADLVYEDWLSLSSVCGTNMLHSLKQEKTGGKENDKDSDDPA